MTARQKIVISNIIVVSTMLFAFILLMFKLSEISINVTSKITIDDILFMATPAIAIISVISVINLLVGFVIVYKIEFISFNKITFICSHKLSHFKTITINHTRNYKELCIFRC